MGKSRKDYEKYLNSISPDRDDEAWIIGGKNRYCGRENYGTMIKRYDPIGFLTWELLRVSLKRVLMIGLEPIFEKLDLDTGDATWLHQSYCCDHCVNHWGIDLCGCGSGQKVGKCECGSQKAHDILGVKYDSFGAILKNFG